MVGVVYLNGRVGNVRNDIGDADDVKRSPGDGSRVHVHGGEVRLRGGRRGRRSENRSITAFDASTLKSGGAGSAAVTTAVIAGGRGSRRRFVRRRLMVLMLLLLVVVVVRRIVIDDGGQRVAGT